MQLLVILFTLASVLGEIIPRQVLIKEVKNLKNVINLYNSSIQTSKLKNHLSTLDKDDKCLNTLLSMVNNFTKNELFARLYSSSGKFINQLGNYRKCIEDGNRYVLFMLYVLKIGFCLPIECEEEHIAILKKYLENISEPLKDTYEGTGTLVYLIDVKAENSKSPSLGTYVLLSISGFILLLSIVAAIVDHVITKEQWNSKSRKALESFNIIKNGEHLFCSENKVDKNLDVLNGVKVLFMGWILQGHSFLNSLMIPPSNSIYAMSDRMSSQRRYAIYVAATFGVDAFFWMTGFLAILVITEQLKNRKKNVILAVLLIYLHRYLRMLPIYILAFVLPYYIIPYLYDGANYNMAKTMNDPCEGIWHYNFLFLNNFIKEGTICMGWTWYIACDFQIYLLVPWIVLLYNWKKLMGYLVVGFLMVGSIIIQFQQLWYYQINSSYLEGRTEHLNKKYYTVPYCRINTFLLGIIMAWIYLSYKEAKRAPEGEEEVCKKSLINRINYSIIHNWVLRYFMYIIGLTITTVCTYTYYEFYKSDKEKPLIAHHFYLVFSKPGFIIGLAFVIYPACLGKGKILRVILGQHIFNVISRTIYAVYMLHTEIVLIYWSMREEPTDASEHSFWYSCIDLFMLTSIVSIVVTVVFEYPIIGISKEFLRPKRAQIISGKETGAKSNEA